TGRKVRQQTINVILTKKRPIPLEHVLYYGDSSANKNAKLTVVDTDGEFLIGNFLAELPQIRLFRQYCQKGFAVHHSGILPLLREIVEILFQRELVKVLFATETFAMGVNMPAKTVVFSSLKKFSGNDNGNRYLLSSEYIQMAGRAGRRGQDTTGSVYIMSTFHLPSEQEFKEMTIGNAMRVTSRFRLTYGMILNLLSGNKTDNKRIENVMRSNFSEFIQFSSFQETRQKILRL
ncbi:hypothetical protein MXB_62, partial [Myxobolus squamalis]